MTNQNIPKLRFKGFEGEWKINIVSDLVEERDVPPNNTLPIYSLTIENGVVPKTERYERSFLLKKGYEYKVIYPNDFVFNPMNLRFGALARYKGNSNVLVSKYYNIFYCKDDFYPSFAEKYLTTKKAINFYDRMSIGTLLEKKRVHFSDFLKFKFKLPQVEEQQKIASFLGKVDEWIENLKEQKENLEKYKKGMMQKIFGQKIRFKDENGKEFERWSEKKLEECLNYIQPTKYIVKNAEYNDNYTIPVLTAGKTFILGYTNEEDNIFNAESLPVIIFDDFTTTSQFVDFVFKVKSSAMKILTPKKNINIRCIYEILKIIKYEVGGHGRHWISKYSKIKINVPSYKEQQKIADFLTSIDKIIDSKQEQIAKAEKWKKSLMQGLFV